MNLTHQEVTQFYKIWCALIRGVNEMRGITPKFDLPVYGKNMHHEPFAAIRPELWGNPEWIDGRYSSNAARCAAYSQGLIPYIPADRGDK